MARAWMAVLLVTEGCGKGARCLCCRPGPHCTSWQCVGVLILGERMKVLRCTVGEVRMRLRKVWLTRVALTSWRAERYWRICSISSGVFATWAAHFRARTDGGAAVVVCRCWVGGSSVARLRAWVCSARKSSMCGMSGSCLALSRG